MSYAIGNVIYGIPLGTNRYNPTGESEWSEELSIAIEDELTGFLQYYSGSGDVPAAFGVELCEFDEACYFVDITGLTLRPTIEQQAEVERAFNALPISLREEIITKFGTPRTFILWSTS